MTSRISCVAILLLATMPGPAVAADTLDEVVVTARRRSEVLENVPLSIDVIGVDSLQTGLVTDLQSLSARVPGLYFESMWGGTNAAPVLRGQAQPSTAGDNVGVFVDGVYQASRAAVDVEPADIERIEVVRGPQNALYGRNTFAGAINYVSKLAGLQSTWGLVADMGSGEARALQGWRSAVTRTGWRGRLAASIRSFAGTTENVAARGARLGGFDRQTLAATLASPDGRRWHAVLRLRYQNAQQDHPPTAALTYRDYNCGSRDPVSNAWSYFCGAIPEPDRFDVSTDIPSSTGEVWQAALHWQFDVGTLRLESDTSQYVADSTSFRDFDNSSAGDLFGVCTVGFNCTGPPGLVRQINRTVRVNQVMRNGDSTHEFTQELRLSGAGPGALRWMTGAIAVDSRLATDAAIGAQRGDLATYEQLTALLPATPSIVGPTSRFNLALVNDPTRQQILQAADRQHTTTFALFASADYTIGNQVRLHAELRGTRERKELDSLLANFGPSFGRAIAPLVFRDISPRASVDWSVAKESLLYLSVAKGSRGGGINTIPGLAPDEQRYQQEYNWTTELGWRIKSTSAGMEAHLAAFYIDWEHTQILGFSNTPGISNLITRNTAGVTTRGFESSFVWSPHPRLSLDASYSWVDPRFRAGSDDPGSRMFCGLGNGASSSTFCIIGNSRGGPATASIFVPWVDGNTPNRTPQNSWHIGSDLRMRVRDGGDYGWAHLEMSYQDDVFDRSIGGAYYGARMLVNMRLGYQRGQMSLQLWCKNLTNARFIRAVASRGAAFYPTVPRPLDLIAGEERQLGISLRYER